jgi:hypothetical protein
MKKTYNFKMLICKKCGDRAAVRLDLTIDYECANCAGHEFMEMPGTHTSKAAIFFVEEGMYENN